MITYNGTLLLDLCRLGEATEHTYPVRVWAVQTKLLEFTGILTPQKAKGKLGQCAVLWLPPSPAAPAAGASPPVAIEHTLNPYDLGCQGFDEHIYRGYRGFRIPSAVLSMMI